ncbi:MAG: patatin-like phospholipase family protein [Magnetococcales bacterium]|nr:patatin-like phospholipase family protein [Magnetococcales bacterium]
MSTAVTNTKQQNKPKIALVLQGGGALGAYHVGVYQALSEAGMLPDWVSGISIGALTSSIIVGNRPEDRVARLEQFWDEISWPDEWGSMLHGESRKFFNQMSYLRTVMFGQPNFWFNRPINPMLLPHVPPDMASICDTTPMLQTLQRLADFNLINKGPVRLSLGVTNVQTGELNFFDNTTQPAHKPIRPEHVLASGSLPPGFPPMRIDGVLYWDGGCVANTPVEIIFQEQNNRPDILVLVELYNTEGPEPTSMDAVTQREKSIRFGDRTLSHMKHLVTSHNLRTHLHHAHGKLAAGESSKAIQEIAENHIQGGMDILHLVYHAGADQITHSEAEFSRPSIADRRRIGYEDMRRVLEKDPISSQSVRQHPGEIVVHHAYKGEVTSHRHA